MGTVLKKLSENLNISVEKLEKLSAQTFLEKEIQLRKTEIISIAQKYGVSSWKEMNDLIIEGKIGEGKILDDFQRVDHLTAEVARLERLLKEISG